MHYISFILINNSYCLVKYWMFMNLLMVFCRFLSYWPVFNSCLYFTNKSKHVRHSMDEPNVLWLNNYLQLNSITLWLQEKQLQRGASLKFLLTPIKEEYGKHFTSSTQYIMSNEKTPTELRLMSFHYSKLHSFTVALLSSVYMVNESSWQLSHYSWIVTAWQSDHWPENCYWKS